MSDLLLQRTNASTVRWAWIAVGLMMIITFVFGTDLFSRQNTLPILWWILSWFGGEGERTVPHFSDQEGWLRKSAHFIEYGLLAFLWMRALRCSRPTIRFISAAWMALAATAAWAAVDELQQGLVSQHRTGHWQDVVLDAAGGLFAVLCTGIGWWFSAQAQQKIPCQ